MAPAQLLLASGPIREDAIQTLLSPQPVDRLLFRKHACSVPLRQWAVEVALVVPLQIAYICRSFLLPVFAVLGTAYAAAAAMSAIDIVLNSV